MSKAWPMVSLSQIAEPISRPVAVTPGTPYRTIGVKWWGEGAYKRETIDGSQTAAKTLSIVRQDDLIINKIWVRHGSTAIASKAVDGCAASGEFPTFELDATQVMTRWLHWYTKTREFWEKCDKLSQGTSGKNRIKPERFLTIEIPLPPLSEQQRIVARIEEMAGKIEEAKNLRKEAIEEADLLMVSSIAKILRRTPQDGCLGDVLLEKPRNGYSAKRDNTEGSIPVLSLSAATGFDYRGTEFKRTSETISATADYWLHKGDLLITRSNTPELVGHAAIYDGSPSPCIYPDLMMRLIVDEAKVNKRFVHYWLMSRPVREYIKHTAKGTSPTMKKISQGNVMSIPFPLHLSIPEQHRIVILLDGLKAKVDALQQLQAETGAEMEALLPSILDKAFWGEL